MFFFQYIFTVYIYIIYISINIYIIYIYLYIYIEKRRERSAFFCKRTKCSCVLLRSLQKNVAFFAFFYVLCKRMLRSLHSFPKNGKDWNVLLGFISRQKLEKRTEKNKTFFKTNRKQQKVPNVLNGKEHGAQPWVYATVDDGRCWIRR